MREGREADDADFVYSFYCNDVSNLILVVANGPTFCFLRHMMPRVWPLRCHNCCSVSHAFSYCDNWRSIKLEK